jgi:hypothetical protein
MPDDRVNGRIKSPPFESLGQDLGFHPTLQVRHKTPRNNEVPSKYRFRDMLSRPDGFDLLGCKDMHWDQARLIKLAQSMLIDRSDVMQGLHCFVNGSKCVATIFFSHFTLPLQIDADKRDMAYGLSNGGLKLKESA